jgi:hypothetical protein
MREAAEILLMMARRLELVGIAFCPAYYHLAASAEVQFRFLDPARQGRFEAMRRDLGHLPLGEVSRAVAEQRVLLDGEPYSWEASPMAYGVEPTDEEAQRTAAERARVRFTIAS